jgi:hypothetical protein
MLWIFVKYQIVFCVCNFPIEILLILTYDLGPVDQDMNSSFHLMGFVSSA